MGVGKRVAVMAMGLTLLGMPAYAGMQDEKAANTRQQRAERSQPSRQAAPRTQAQPRQAAPPKAAPRAQPRERAQPRQAPRTQEASPQRKAQPRQPGAVDTRKSTPQTRRNHNQYDRHRHYRPRVSIGWHLGWGHHNHYYGYGYHRWSPFCWEWSHYSQHHLHHDSNAREFSLRPPSGFYDADARVLRERGRTSALLELTESIGRGVGLTTLVDEDFDGDIDYGTYGEGRWKRTARQPRNTYSTLR